MPRKRTTSNRVNNYEHRLSEPNNHDSLETKYNEIFNAIVKDHLDEIQARFDSNDIKVINLIANVIKLADLKSLSELKQLNFYNHMLDFDRLKSELKSWQTAIAPVKPCKKIKGVSIGSIKEFVINNVSFKY